MSVQINFQQREGVKLTCGRGLRGRAVSLSAASSQSFQPARSCLLTPSHRSTCEASSSSRFQPAGSATSTRRALLPGTPRGAASPDIADSVFWWSRSKTGSNDTAHLIIQYPHIPILSPEYSKSVSFTARKYSALSIGIRPIFRTAKLTTFSQPNC